LLRRRPRFDCETSDGGPPGSTSHRIVDIACLRSRNGRDGKPKAYEVGGFLTRPKQAPQLGLQELHIIRP